MARDRSRARRAGIDTGEPGGGDVEPDEESDDLDGERGDWSGATIEDLRSGGRGRVQSETAPGSQADLAIDPSINPGFVDTEVVNRVGLVLSLQCYFDSERGFWTPLTDKDLSSSSYSSGLLKDTIAENLGNVIGTQNGTSIDGNGNLVVSDGDVGFDLPADATESIVASSTTDGAQVTFDSAYSSFKIEPWFGTRKPDEVHFQNVSTGSNIGTVAYNEPHMDLPFSVNSSDTYEIHWHPLNTTFDQGKYGNLSLPIGHGIGQVTAGVDNNNTTSNRFYTLRGIGLTERSNSGTATTAFATPSRSTEYDKALYNATPNGGSYRVDLYSGDPNSSSGELLARDISPREDISDIPPSKGPLQLKIHMQRSDQGDSPRVSLAGVQYER
jgi:hypothetical protein